MTRVCIISQYFIPDIGGAVTRLTNLLKILRAMDLEVVIITTVPHYPKGEIPSKYRTRWKYIERFDKITIVRTRMLSNPHNSFKNRLVNYFFFIGMSLSVLSLSGKIDLIWVTSPNFFGNVSGIVYKLIKRKPLILNVDDFWPDVIQELGALKSSFLIRLANLFNILAYNYCDYITPISPMIKRKLIERYSISPSKIHVIEVGANYYDYRKGFNAFNDSKRGKGIISGKSEHLFIYSGILGPAYDFDMMLRAAKILEEENKFPFKLIIHGKGESESYIRLQIAKLGLNQTTLISSQMNHEDYIQFLLSATVFLLPMKKGIYAETAIPSKIFIYLMFDRPIISTKGGDVELILNESSAGFTVSNNYKEFAEAIKYLITDNITYNRYCNKGSLYVKKHFDLLVIKKKVERLLKIWR